MYVCISAHMYIHPAVNRAGSEMILLPLATKSQLSSSRSVHQNFLDLLNLHAFGYRWPPCSKYSSYSPFHLA